MKERPILFSASMVNAILAGTKTQTRRIVKAKGTPFASASGAFIDMDASAQQIRALPCKYGEPGDRLWVRETWYCDHFDCQVGPYIQPNGWEELLYYKARDDAGGGMTWTGFSGEKMRNPWRPSIHMPRWASRITLEIEDVRVERLQKISEADATAEGAFAGARKFGQIPIEPAVFAFKDLWESIHGPGSWAANPWVWVVCFRHVKP
jgi:hypothetical protein